MAVGLGHYQSLVSSNECYRTLSDLAGAWAGTETLSPSPWSPGGTAHGRHAFALALDGTALLHDYTQERDGAVDAHRPRRLARRTPTAATSLWFWFDSIGFVPPGARARRWDGATPRWSRTTPRGTQRARSTSSTTRAAPPRSRSASADATDFAPVATARYARG